MFKTIMLNPNINLLKLDEQQYLNICIQSFMIKI